MIFLSSSLNFHVEDEEKTYPQMGIGDLNLGKRSREELGKDQEKKAFCISPLENVPPTY